nr:hypothetical protein TQ38_24305 [Novosphingobium sp. P6W]
MTAVMAILAGFPAAMSCWFGFEIRIEAGGDQGRHVEDLSNIGPAAADEAFAFPLSGLARDGSKSDMRGGLLVIERSEFGHGGDDLVGGECAEASDAGENVVAPGELCIGSNDGRDFSVERGDVACDLFEPLAALALERNLFHGRSPA